MFCGIRCIFDFLGCEIPTVLSGPFFLIINCLFTCFDRIVVPSVKSGCHIKPARGTGNFGIILFSSGNRHKFTSMFSCASLVHPCTSVACFLMKFPVSLTAFIRHLYFDEPCSNSYKHQKDSPDNKIYLLHNHLLPAYCNGSTIFSLFEIKFF